MNVLFVCVANSGRSVMAERLFRRLADNRHQADVRRISWELPDPKNLALEQVRPTREEIRRRVEQLVAELDQRELAAG